MGFTKRIRITALLLTVMVLAGCSAQPNISFSESKQDSNAVPQTSDVSKGSTTTEDFSSQEATTENAKETEEQTVSESTGNPEKANEVEITASEPIISSQPATDKPKTAKAETVTAETEKTKSPAVSTETPVIPSESTAQTEKQPITEPVTEAVTEAETTPESEPEPEPAAPFDIDYWVSYAKTTAQKNGLSLDSTATDCWDNPITAKPDSIYLERDIISRMSRYVRDGFTSVWVWYECVGTDSYLIYVGYA